MRTQYAKPPSYDWQGPSSSPRRKPCRIQMHPSSHMQLGMYSQHALNHATSMGQVPPNAKDKHISSQTLVMGVSGPVLQKYDYVPHVPCPTQRCCHKVLVKYDSIQLIYCYESSIGHVMDKCGIANAAVRRVQASALLATFTVCKLEGQAYCLLDILRARIAKALSTESIEALFQPGQVGKSTIQPGAAVHEGTLCCELCWTGPLRGP